MSRSSSCEEQNKKNDLVFVAKFLKNYPFIRKKGKTSTITTKKEQVLFLLKNENENRVKYKL